MKAFLNSRIVQHLVFWLSIFAYFIITANMVFYKDYTHLIQSTIGLMVPQIIAAYLLLDLFIPKMLNKKKHGLFALSTSVSLVILFIGYVAVRKYYFDAVYIEVYNDIAKSYAQMPLGERLLDPSLFFSKLVKFLTPAALLFTYSLYKNQQNILQLREQKRTAELSALKNQLNPHFLFNTLNNLYALSIEGSDKAPEVIERLSEILDYMLYRCKENYVSLDKEVALIENYLALEKIRYGKRVTIAFENKINGNFKIAPLILLTFIENAFKHGVSQELGLAEITIVLDADDKTITFSIINTKPTATKDIMNQNNKALGLANIKKQLDLLYPKAYQLKINCLAASHEVQLKIPAHGL
ncbi:histidine kinase [uncultured Croceitalea sp.]|uniref:sensor histidine kinase n=1 Tax=uncultured Croceitalea sp. TaxID=1798908 RepID=UPI0033065418